MLRYIVRRLLQSVFVILGVTFVAFGLMFLRGDPANLMLSEHATQQEIQELRQRMGFDRPWPEQYARYVAKAVQGDFGTSLFHRTDAMRVVVERLPATLELAIAALLLSVLVAVSLGTVAAVYRNSLWDRISIVVAMVGQAVPNYFLGVLLILFLGVRWNLLPISGRDSWQHLVMPAITLAALPLAQNTRMVRSSLLEVLGQDYIRTAHAKGLPHGFVIWRHGLRNALIPLITLVGLQFGYLISGAIIVETIFAWPGVGRLILQAVGVKDFPVIQAAVTILATIFVLLNLIVDIAYTYLDPRIRSSIS
ncbi:MAG: ABC transporter permease [Caldilineaceae bacterium]|nr:ABC transporter permease [Caldilineaceae bacterium]